MFMLAPASKKNYAFIEQFKRDEWKIQFATVIALFSFSYTLFFFNTNCDCLK